MSKVLNVYFQEMLIGKLVQDNHGDINFSYLPDWLENPNAVSISHALPLQNKTFKRKECSAFFEGILPEESTRKLIAKNLGISANNDFSMLEKIGGECAGALTFLPQAETPFVRNDDYHELSEVELAKILHELPLRPLLAGEQGVRLSLAGVQDKIALYMKDKKSYIPLNNAPSTHILKPDFTHYEGLIFNEAFCLNLAKKVELSVANAEIKKAGDVNYLSIERYDRNFLSTDTIQRLHQEDFCQALNISSRHKYQNEGGPSLKQCFDLIRVISSTPVIDLDKMLNAVIFNYFIGNCDAHGKNFSILYQDGIQLAPLYDLISTVYYKEVSTKMAMKLGSGYQINEVNLSDFDAFATETGLAKPGVRKRIENMRDSILAALTSVDVSDAVQQDLVALIKKRCLAKL